MKKKLTQDIMQANLRHLPNQRNHKVLKLGEAEILGQGKRTGGVQVPKIHYFRSDKLGACTKLLSTLKGCA
jgi:hypothetical protein